MNKPYSVHEFFNEDVLFLIRKEIAWLKSGNAPGVDQDLDQFKRLEQHNNPFFKTLHEMLALRQKDYWFGEKIKPSYCFVSMYYTGEGICPPHVDRPQCKYTIGLCVNQREIWPINIDGIEFNLTEGQAVLYSGTDHLHYRDRIQPTNYCDMVFFHFVPEAFEGTLD